MLFILIVSSQNAPVYVTGAFNFDLTKLDFSVSLLFIVVLIEEGVNDIIYEFVLQVEEIENKGT